MVIRIFPTGASRNNDTNKLNYEGFFCPLFKKAFATYMHKHTFLEDGSQRRADNWQKGIPTESAMESLLRHVEDLHSEYRGYGSRDGIEEALGGIIFNTQVIWSQLEKNKLKNKN